MSALLGIVVLAPVVSIILALEADATVLGLRTNGWLDAYVSTYNTAAAAVKMMKVLILKSHSCK